MQSGVRLRSVPLFSQSVLVILYRQPWEAAKLGDHERQFGGDRLLAAAMLKEGLELSLSPKRMGEMDKGAGATWSVGCPWTFDVPLEYSTSPYKVHHHKLEHGSQIRS